jgi:Arc/MetJ family transcription regulator
MLRRTTIEIDQELLDRARRVLGGQTVRATVEEALRRLALAGESEQAIRAARQRRYLESLAERIDAQVLASEEMWR